METQSLTLAGALRSQLDELITSYGSVFPA
jgi:hypothetical protein